MSSACLPIRLAALDIDAQRGFLPSSDPLDRLPPAFDAWEEAAHYLPKWLVSGRIRRFLERLPCFDVSQLTDERQYRRAMVLLSFLGHAYIWGENDPAARLPAILAVPWHAVAKVLERPPVLSYASYALDNWRRLDPSNGVALGNIALLQNFLGGIDEEWFVLVHVDIEAKAAPALAAMGPLQEAVAEDRPERLEPYFSVIEDVLHQMYATLARMPEHCDPYIYYHRVRPYIHGWKNNPALPKGVIYEGVADYGGAPQFFRGETGAQSAVIPALDALFGIQHEEDPLKTYLMEMRYYMPVRHRRFIEAIEQGPSLRNYLGERKSDFGRLIELYNRCVSGIERFRSLHLEYAATYIYRQGRISPTNPANVGTGGTPFMRYLRKHRDETVKHQL